MTLDTDITWSWRLLRAGRFRLDGGSMFGLVPKVVWSKAVSTDDRGRIEVQHNCLLLERTGGADGPRVVLIEVGTGDKLDAKSRDIFALEDRSIIDALREVGKRPAEIEAVFVSHLHFDHAGGLTRRVQPGETPDWTPDVSNPKHQGLQPVKLTFPNATVFAQSREWSDALANRSVMTRTYFADHLDPICDGVGPGRGRAARLDSPRPWPIGVVPGRDDLPPVPVTQRMTQAIPGVFAFLCPGHTWGQQAIAFVDDRRRVVVFTPDVLPTAAHVGAAYSLAYDVEPYTSMITRHWLLESAAAGDWVLVLDHEPGHPVFRVRRGDRGWYELIPEQP